MVSKGCVVDYLSVRVVPEEDLIVISTSTDTAEASASLEPRIRIYPIPGGSKSAAARTAMPEWLSSITRAVRAFVRN